MRCPFCDHDNSSERRFCGECGAALAAICAACGASNGSSEKFCGGCGERLQPAAPAVAAPTPTPEPEAVLPAGERRQLTVLFCDLVGSTPLSQQLDAEEWRDVISRYQRAATEAVEKFGGHVAKNLGDGLLIYFGWPTAREDDPERAVRAGLEIVEAVRQLAVMRLGNDAKEVATRLAVERLEEEETFPSDPLTAHRLTANSLSVRVGMHTGPVVIADGGEVFGETVNVAARVQGAAEPDTVVISAATQRLVAGIFVAEDRGAHTLKGVREPVQLYRIVQPSGVRSRLDVAGGHLTRFVGREMELGTLLDRWERVTEGQGQNVLLVGDAGVGKSRLAWELRARLASEPHTWLECRTMPYTQGTPFFLVIELVMQVLAFGSEDGEDEKVAKLERGLGLLPEPLAETVPVVARLLGLSVPERYPHTDMGPDMERQRVLEILAAWNLALGEVQPLVLLVEDIHWCDDSSLQLLGRIIEQSATAQVLFLATARPEFVSPWPARSNTTTLQLARLTKRQAREMVTALGAALPDETLDALIGRADGVPLYIEELTKVVAEAGAAKRADAIPATLADSLMARLDRLPSAAKELAQRAAVLGREFPYSLLAAISDTDDARLRTGLARLAEAEILFVRGEPPAATYTFKHALVQEVAYESLLKRARQQFHARLCDVLAGLSAEPEVLAHHAERAGRIDDAIGYLTSAGEQAQARSAHAEAVRQLENAIALGVKRGDSGANDARLADLQLALGASLVAVRGHAHPKTLAAFEGAALRADHCHRALTLQLARLGVACAELNRGELEKARARAAAVLLESEASEISEITVIARSVLSVIDGWLGRFESSLRYGDLTLAEYDLVQHHYVSQRLGGAALVAICTATILAQVGRFDAALARGEEAAMHAERSKDPFNMAWALGWRAFLEFLCGENARQREWASQAIALADRFGFPLFSGLGRILRGAARVSAGDEDGAVEILDGIHRAGRTRIVVTGTMAYGILAAAQHRIGQVEQAQTALAMAMSLVRQTGERWWQADLHVVDAALAGATGAPLDDVLTRLRTARAVADELGALRPELTATMAMARALRDAGHLADARAALAPVYTKFTQGFGTPLLVEAKALLDELG